MEVNQPDPDILEVLLPQSQKLLKDVLTDSNGRSKCTKYQMLSDKEKKRRREESTENRYNLTTGFNLLKKCVPGTKKSNRPDILMSAVNYIRELENYIRELENCIEKRINYTTPLPMESTQLFSTPTDCDPVPSTGMKQDSGHTTLHYYPVPNTGMEQESDSTLDCYIVDCTDMDEHLERTAIVKEPSSPMAEGASSPMGEGPSSPMVYTTELVTGLSSLMAEYSDISVPNSPMVEGHNSPMVTAISEPSSPMAEGSTTPVVKITVASTPMEDHSTDAIGVPIEMAEQTSSDEIAQWVGVNLNSEEEEEELPEFNSVEELSQWLGL
jgi:hypothetical protein